jgi:hypothetical protein
MPLTVDLSIQILVSARLYRTSCSYLQMRCQGTANDVNKFYTVSPSDGNYPVLYRRLQPTEALHLLVPSVVSVPDLMRMTHNELR